MVATVPRPCRLKHWQSLPVILKGLLEIGPFHLVPQVAQGLCQKRTITRGPVQFHSEQTIVRGRIKLIEEVVDHWQPATDATLCMGVIELARNGQCTVQGTIGWGKFAHHALVGHGQQGVEIGPLIRIGSAHTLGLSEHLAQGAKTVHGRGDQSGMLPCFLRGSLSTLFRNMSSAAMTFRRVWLGRITSST